MSWAARITKAPDGGLRLVFSEPLRQLDMDAAVARWLGALLLVAAEEAKPGPVDNASRSKRGKRHG